MSPHVSIIMPAYNRQAYIAEAIQSVLKQSYQDWELIVVDDASTDSTVSIVEGLAQQDVRIKLIKNPQNSGISITRNRGIEASSGTYIAMLDSDDVWIDIDKLQKQVTFLDAHVADGYALVYTGIVLMDANGVKSKEIAFAGDDAKIRGRILARNPIAQSSVLFTRQAYEQAGKYNSEFKVADDHDLWLRIGSSHKFFGLPDIAVGYRIHSGGISKQRVMRQAREGFRLVRRWSFKYPNTLWAWIVALLRFAKALIVKFTYVGTN